MATSDFGKAFRAAREAGDKEFEFGGKKYNTKMKDDDSAPAKKAEPKASQEFPKTAAPKYEAAPVKEAAPAKSLAMPDTYRDLSGKVKVKEAVKPPSEYEPGPQNIKRNLLNAPSDISDLVSSPFRAIREAGNRGNPDAKKMASGGSVSASRRGDGIAQRGKTRGKMC